MVAIIDQNADLNRDGIVDSDDQNLIGTDDYHAMPAGHISAPYASSGTGNIVGYAGYLAGAEIHGGGLYTVRHRHYAPDLGRWLSRDPLGYVDGMSLYGYVRNIPTHYIDPSGLLSDDAKYSCRAGVGRQVANPTTDCDKCCTDACNRYRGRSLASARRQLGLIVCCGQSATSCICSLNIPLPSSLRTDNDEGECFVRPFEDCIKRHEDVHKKDVDCRRNNPDELGLPIECRDLWRDPVCGPVCSECDAMSGDAECIRNIDCGPCNTPEQKRRCENLKRYHSREADRRAKKNCEDCEKCRKRHGQ